MKLFRNIFFLICFFVNVPNSWAGILSVSCLQHQTTGKTVCVLGGGHVNFYNPTDTYAPIESRDKELFFGLLAALNGADKRVNVLEEDAGIYGPIEEVGARKKARIEGPYCCVYMTLAFLKRLADSGQLPPDYKKNVQFKDGGDVRGKSFAYFSLFFYDVMTRVRVFISALVKFLPHYQRALSFLGADGKVDISDDALCKFIEVFLSKDVPVAKSLKELLLSILKDCKYPGAQFKLDDIHKYQNIITTFLASELDKPICRKLNYDECFTKILKNALERLAPLVNFFGEYKASQLPIAEAFVVALEHDDFSWLGKWLAWQREVLKLLVGDVGMLMEIMRNCEEADTVIVLCGNNHAYQLNKWLVEKLHFKPLFPIAGKNELDFSDHPGEFFADESSVFRKLAEKLEIGAEFVDDPTINAAHIPGFCHNCLNPGAKKYTSPVYDKVAWYCDDICVDNPKYISMADGASMSSAFVSSSSLPITLEKGASAAMTTHACAFCGKTDKDGAKLFICGDCKSIYYCSKECQKKDWKRHKLECQKKSK